MKCADRGGPCVRPKTRPRPKRTETRRVVFYAARLLIGPAANAPSWLDAPRYGFLSGHAAAMQIGPFASTYKSTDAYHQ